MSTQNPLTGLHMSTQICNPSKNISNLKVLRICHSDEKYEKRSNYQNYLNASNYSLSLDAKQFKTVSRFLVIMHENPVAKFQEQILSNLYITLFYPII